MHILFNHGNSTYCGEESILGNYAISLSNFLIYLLLLW